MKNKKLVTIFAAILILAVGIGVGAYAASNFGTQADPLVAKSYLDKTLTPKLQAEFQAKLDAEVKKLEDEITGAGSGQSANFKSVNLTSGQTLSGNVGCEIILRSGTATAAGSNALTDVTDGKAIAVGSAVTANHLCVPAADGDGVKAGSAVTMLVRGTYKIA